MCGIFGIEHHEDAANMAYLGLYAQQHRGQESAGIVSWDGNHLSVQRGMGMVADIFRAKEIADPLDLILVCGSLFTVGEAMTYVDPEKYKPDEID